VSLPVAQPNVNFIALTQAGVWHKAALVHSCRAFPIAPGHANLSALACDDGWLALCVRIGKPYAGFCLTSMRLLLQGSAAALSPAGNGVFQCLVG
jgi:hypothetical protein